MSRNRMAVRSDSRPRRPDSPRDSHREPARGYRRDDDRREFGRATGRRDFSRDDDRREDRREDDRREYRREDDRREYRRDDDRKEYRRDDNRRDYRRDDDRREYRRVDDQGDDAGTYRGRRDDGDQRSQGELREERRGDGSQSRGPAADQATVVARCDSHVVQPDEKSAPAVATQSLQRAPMPDDDDPFETVYDSTFDSLHITAADAVVENGSTEGGRRRKGRGHGWDAGDGDRGRSRSRPKRQFLLKAKTDMQTGDWICHKCRFQNSNTVCAMCRTAQPGVAQNEGAPSPDVPSATAGVPVPPPQPPVSDPVVQFLAQGTDERLTGPITFKKFVLDQVQIRSLIGKQGATIKQIRADCGDTEVTVQHQRDQEFGTVRITGNVEKAEKLIMDVLSRTGCLVSRQVPQPFAKKVGGPTIRIVA